MTRKPTRRRIDNRARLRAFQREFLHMMIQPLSMTDEVASRWRDGRPMSDVASELIRPASRLTALDRLQIYARTYWHRLSDCLAEECPGLVAVLGDTRFDALCRAYLEVHPPRSCMLQNVSSRLAQFIEDTPSLTAPHAGLCHAIAQFERAQTVALDGEGKASVTAEHVLALPPECTRIALQPHITLLALDWPVDDFCIAIRNEAAEPDLRAKRKPVQRDRAAAAKRLTLPRRQRVHVVVHRYALSVFYKRLDRRAFAALSALRAGHSLAEAARASHSGRLQFRTWLAEWSGLGWFCRRR